MDFKKLGVYSIIFALVALFAIASIAAATNTGIDEGFSLFDNSDDTVNVYNTIYENKVIYDTQISQATTTMAVAISNLQKSTSKENTAILNQITEIQTSLDKAIAALIAQQNKMNALTEKNAKNIAYITMLEQQIAELNAQKAALDSARAADAEQIAKLKAVLAKLQASRKILRDAQPGLQDWKAMGSFGNILGLIFGDIAEVTASQMNSMIITICVWLLIFVTFGDIIATFSTFSTWVSWTTAGLMGIIAANLGFATRIIAWSTGVFASLGAIAVYVGLGGAFLAFIAVNLGLGFAKNWIVRRRAMMTAATSRAGGKALAGTIAGLGTVGKALSKIP